MELSRKPFRFSDGREITLTESTWESSSIRSSIEERARADRARLNGSGDVVFLLFLETYYSYLASCSSGDVPSAEDAYRLPDEDIDRWYRTVVEVNPGGFIEIDFDRSGEVSFRDGSSYTIVSSFLPSVTMKRARLEEAALKREPDREKPKDVFAVYLYPLLASCSIGEIPEPSEIRSTWPETEIYKWRDAVRDVNPHLFGSPEEVSSQSLKEARDLEKKSKKSRVKSPRS